MDFISAPIAALALALTGALSLALVAGLLAFGAMMLLVVLLDRQVKAVPALTPARRVAAMLAAVTRADRAAIAAEGERLLAEYALQEEIYLAGRAREFYGIMVERGTAARVVGDTEAAELIEARLLAQASAVWAAAHNYETVEHLFGRKEAGKASRKARLVSQERAAARAAKYAEV